MFFRYHAPQTTRPAGPWEKASRSGSGPPYREDYHGWNVEVTQCRVGFTVKRTQYRVRLQNSDLATEHSLAGFPTQSCALAAAQRWIDGRHTHQQLVAQRRRAEHHRRKNRKTDGS